MGVTVLLSSGDADEWSDSSAEVTMDLGGALIIRDGEGDESPVLAVYAPGMWMKFEINRDEDE